MCFWIPHCKGYTPGSVRSWDGDNPIIMFHLFVWIPCCVYIDRLIVLLHRHPKNPGSEGIVDNRQCYWVLFPAVSTLVAMWQEPIRLWIQAPFTWTSTGSRWMHDCRCIYHWGCRCVYGCVMRRRQIPTMFEDQHLSSLKQYSELMCEGMDRIVLQYHTLYQVPYSQRPQLWPMFAHL